MIGESPAFNSIMDTIEAIAARKCSVIIFGETGTGKEMVARQIHNFSDRVGNTFIPVDCTTLTGQLFESQLFGHVKGAFTGAVDSTLGFFRAANEGTIFLDEISEIPLELQAKLLRVLQEETVTPVGSTQTFKIDVRVLCATNKDLFDLVRKGKFREDLYYRLNVVSLEIPPLRERQEDIMSLATHFLANQAKFYQEPEKVLTERAVEVLTEYSWPGNVRELANAMEHAYVLSRSEEIIADVLPTEILMAEQEGTGRYLLPTLNAAQKKLISEALELTGGKKVAAAKILGIERRRLNRLIDKLEIAVPKGRD